MWNESSVETIEEREWNTSLTFDAGRRRSELCKAKDWQLEWYNRWSAEICETPRFHRKQWEYTYILQALWERGCIAKDRKGLVFAVGSEPLPSLMAKYGCYITATDIFPEAGAEMGWTNGDQLCFGLESLNKRNIVDDATLRKHVRYQPVDMNHIPSSLKDYDFTWSSCSFEHLGGIEEGLNFLKNQMSTLKPGGWAVHTTEFNISSNEKTLDTGNTVIFRMRDLEKLAEELRAEGHFVEELDYSLGGLPEDFMVDTFPYKQDVHVKLQLNEYVVTSIGLIIRKKKERKIFGLF